MKKLLLVVGAVVVLTACASQETARTMAEDRGFTVLSTEHAPIDAARANVTFGTCTGRFVLGSTGNVQLYDTTGGTYAPIDGSLAYVEKLKEIDLFKKCFSEATSQSTTPSP